MKDILTDKFRILVVDDEVEVLKILEQHLSFLGYDVITANNGKQALEKLKEVRCDILVTDVKMPEMDGEELLRLTRNEYPMMYKIVMTGYVSLDSALACIRYGAMTYILKPIDLDEIENAIEKAMEHLTQWQEKLKTIIMLDKS